MGNTFGFGTALKYLKENKSVGRKIWQDKKREDIKNYSMYIFLTDGSWLRVIRSYNSTKTTVPYWDVQSYKITNEDIISNDWFLKPDKESEVK